MGLLDVSFTHNGAYESVIHGYGAYEGSAATKSTKAHSTGQQAPRALGRRAGSWKAEDAGWSGRWMDVQTR